MNMASKGISNGTAKAVKEKKCRKVQKKPYQNLCISKKCRTFAPAFEKESKNNNLGAIV